MHGRLQSLNYGTIPRINFFFNQSQSWRSAISFGNLIGRNFKFNTWISPGDGSAEGEHTVHTSQNITRNAYFDGRSLRALKHVQSSPASLRSHTCFEHLFGSPLLQMKWAFWQVCIPVPVGISCYDEWNSWNAVVLSRDPQVSDRAIIDCTCLGGMRSVELTELWCWIDSALPGAVS